MGGLGLLIELFQAYDEAKMPKCFLYGSLKIQNKVSRVSSNSSIRKENQTLGVMRRENDNVRSGQQANTLKERDFIFQKILTKPTKYAFNISICSPLGLIPTNNVEIHDQKFKSKYNLYIIFQSE